MNCTTQCDLPETHKPVFAKICPKTCIIFLLKSISDDRLPAVVVFWAATAKCCFLVINYVCFLNITVLCAVLIFVFWGFLVLKQWNNDQCFAIQTQPMLCMSIVFWTLEITMQKYFIKETHREYPYWCVISFQHS